MASPVHQFLNSTSNHKAFKLPLPFLWKVEISNVDTGAINTAISKVNDKWRAEGSFDKYIKDGNILVAQEVSIPNESYTVSPIGVDNRGGFLPGYGVNERTDFLSRGLTINFLETGIDIEHTLIRPWTIAIGVDGLLNQALRQAIITVRQYDQTGDIRKGYKFTDVFPTNVEGATYNYEDDQYKVKTATFACHNYEPI
jgi:hypothetical protein